MSQSVLDDADDAASCTVPVLVQVLGWFSFLWGWAAPIRPVRFPESVPVCLPFALHDATNTDASHVIPSFGIPGMFPCEESLPETILLEDSWRFVLEHDVRRNVLEQLMVSWHSAVAAQALANSPITSSFALGGKFTNYTLTCWTQTCAFIDVYKFAGVFLWVWICSSFINTPQSTVRQYDSTFIRVLSGELQTLEPEFSTHKNT